VPHLRIFPVSAPVITSTMWFRPTPKRDAERVIDARISMSRQRAVESLCRGSRQLSQPPQFSPEFLAEIAKQFPRGGERRIRRNAPSAEELLAGNALLSGSGFR